MLRIFRHLPEAIPAELPLTAAINPLESGQDELLPLERSGFIPYPGIGSARCSVVIFSLARDAMILPLEKIMIGYARELVAKPRKGVAICSGVRPRCWSKTPNPPRPVGSIRLWRWLRRWRS